MSGNRNNGVSLDQLLEILLDQIDEYTNESRRCIHTCGVEACIGKKTVKKGVNLKPFAHIDDVMYRFYLLNRLSKMQQIVMQYVNAVEPKKTVTRADFFDSNVRFTHKYVIACVQDMERKRTIKPLLELLSDAQ